MHLEHARRLTYSCSDGKRSHGEQLRLHARPRGRNHATSPCHRRRTLACAAQLSYPAFILVLTLAAITLSRQLAGAEPALAPVLKAALATNLHFAANVDHYLDVLSEPVPLPSLTSAASTALPAFAIFDLVPESGADGFRPSDRPINASLKALIPKIQLGKRKLDAAQQKQFDAARDLLFDDAAATKPSDIFKVYKDFEQKIAQLDATLQGPLSPAEKLNVQAQRSATLSEWSLVGRRAEVSAALNTYAALTPSIDSALFLSWKKALDIPTDYSGVWQALGSFSDWISIETTVPSSTEVRLTFRSTHGAAVQTIVLTGLRSIGFRLARVAIQRAWTSGPFWSSRLWRSQDFVISDGDPTVDTSSEIIPRYVSELLLAKQLELRFKTLADWQTFADAVSGAEESWIGGLPIASRDSFVYLAPLYAATARPYVIAVVVNNVPKVPNPDPGATWP